MRLASAVTLINVLVATGFSIIGLVRPDLIMPTATMASGASAIFAMYAAARAIPLAVAVILAVLSRSPVALLIPCAKRSTRWTFGRRLQSWWMMPMMASRP